MENGAIKTESTGFVGKQNDQQKEFSIWLLSLPPINLWNIKLIYRYFNK